MRAPPEGFVPFDVDAPDENTERAIAACPGNAKVRGMFMSDLQRPLREAAPAHAALQRRYTAFLDYPMRDFLALLLEVASICFPHAPRNEAIRRLGLRAYPQFAGTNIGRAVFLPLGNNPARVFGAAASKAYGLCLKPAHVKILDQGPDYVHNETKLKMFLYAYNVGVLEGALKTIEVDGRVYSKRIDLFHAEFFITW